MKHLISDKRRTLPMIAATVLLGAFPAAGLAQELSAIELKTTKLTERIYLLEAEPPRAGNLAVSVGEDGIILVDDQMMPITPKIKAAIAKINGGKIAFVINTHYHFDHAGGNAAFGEEATIVAHRNVRKRLKEGRQAGTRFIEGTRPSVALPCLSLPSMRASPFIGTMRPSTSSTSRTPRTPTVTRSSSSADQTSSTPAINM